MLGMARYRMLKHGHGVGTQGEPEMIISGDDSNFSSRLVAAFEAQVQVPLMGRVGQSPAEVTALIDTLRGRLAALESLVPGQPVGRGAGGAAGLSGLPELPSAGTMEADDIGRNQRSRVRELTLLEALEAEHHALSLPQLTRALGEAGFDDTSAAIVSQLHRLKKLGVIAQPANGMYVLTPDGVLHVRELRKNFGHLKQR
jgi:hypothetical protein